MTLALACPNNNCALNKGKNNRRNVYHYTLKNQNGCQQPVVSGVCSDFKAT